MGTGGASICGIGSGSGTSIVSSSDILPCSSLFISIINQLTSVETGGASICGIGSGSGT